MLSTTRELSPSSPRRASKRRRRRRRRPCCCCCVQTHLFRRFFFFLLYSIIHLRGFKNSGVFDLSFFGDTFKGWKPTENHFTCVSPRLPLPPSSFSPRLSPTTTTTETQRFLSFFLRRGGASIRRASTRTRRGVLID